MRKLYRNLKVRKFQLILIWKTKINNYVHKGLIATEHNRLYY